MNKTPINMMIHPELREVAELFVFERRKKDRGYSLSKFAEAAMITKLRCAGIKLPEKFNLKSAAR